MDILLAAKHPPGGASPFGGVQSWCETVAAILVRRGHRAFFWGPELPLPDREYDVGFFANIEATASAVPFCRSVMSISHGIIDAERPDGEMSTLFTSEGVQQHWRQHGTILRQPIDLRFWSPQGPRSNVAVFYSYRARDPFCLPEVAARMGMPFLWMKNVDHKTAREGLCAAAIVFASGRAALESMACGATTVICDHRPYHDGPLICTDQGLAMWHNYSGRGGALVESASQIIDAAREAMRNSQLETVRRHHDAELIVDQLLALTC